jgi:hypothetical protein
MKNRKRYIYFTALFAMVFGLSACFNYLDNAGNTGSIRINLGSVGDRLAVTDIEKEKMTYTITLTSDDGKEPITRKFSNVGKTIIIEVSEGSWDIEIEAEQERTGSQYRVLKGRGKTEDQIVNAGEITPVVVDMTTTATRVYTWDDLCNDLADNDLKNLDYIQIAANLTATRTAESRGTIRIENILRAEKDITITRGKGLKDPLFRIRNRFILEGNITLDGDNDNDNTSALLNVEGGGHLIIRDEVNLRNNFSIEGGGVCVKNGGNFTMRGGTISGNTAGRGGGVFVENSGFNKTGGTIYGFGSGSLSNIANTAGGGFAVYINGESFDNTLSTGDNLSR